jgi:tetratricopeptide (TPR) repeat protein
MADLERAWQLAAVARDAARRFGSAHDLRWLETGIMFEDYTRGDWDAALRRADEFIQACADTPHYHEAANRLHRAFIRIARDDVDGAIEDSEAALALARAAKDKQAILPALCWAAFAFGEAGRADRAEAVGRELLGLLREDAWGLVRPLVEFTFAAMRLSFVDELHRLLVAPPTTSPWIDVARMLLDGRHAAAADVFAEIGARPYEAFARLRAAGALAADGDRRSADEQLRRALAFYRSVGATRYVREGEALLAAAS